MAAVRRDPPPAAGRKQRLEVRDVVAAAAPAIEVVLPSSAGRVTLFEVAFTGGCGSHPSGNDMFNGE
jgi:hypothetical protein